MFTHGNLTRRRFTGSTPQWDVSKRMFTYQMPLFGTVPLEFKSHNTIISKTIYFKRDKNSMLIFYPSWSCTIIPQKFSVPFAPLATGTAKHQQWCIWYWKASAEYSSKWRFCIIKWIYQYNNKKYIKKKEIKWHLPGYFP